MKDIFHDFHEVKMVLRDIEYTSLMWYNDGWEGCPFIGIDDRFHRWESLLIGDTDPVYLLEIHPHGLGMTLMSKSDVALCIHMLDLKEFV